jgi:hypothetical protein
MGTLVNINSINRLKIKAYLEVFVENVVTEFKSKKVDEYVNAEHYLSLKSKSEGKSKPFHAAIIPAELIRINMFERSFSTKLGSTFEECGKIIGSQYHKQSERGYSMKGVVSKAADDHIKNLIVAFEHAAEAGHPRPSLENMIESVLKLAGDKDEVMSLEVKADLFIEANDGTKYFFEIKSPKPNKGQCLEVLQRILRIHLLLNERRPKVQCFFAMGYNPYGPDRRDYKWSFALNYTPYNEIIIIGSEFWDKIVGPEGTMKELLDIYREVGKDKSKFIVDSLAYGF